MSNVIKIKRLCMGGKVNANGYLFEEETMNNALKHFMETNGKVKLDTLTVNELNRKMLENSLKLESDGDWDLEVIGKIVDFDNETISVELNNIDDIDKYDKMEANIHVISTDIDLQEEYKLAKIDKIQQILIRDYNDTRKLR